MQFDIIQDEIHRFWDEEVMPSLAHYIQIPCESPAFDREWEKNGHIEAAVAFLERWAELHLVSVPGASVETIRIAGRTPSLFIDIPGNGESSILVYGHFDKQPPMKGWATGRSAWTAVLEGDRLYGRGGADDGYALFSALTAILTLRGKGLPHPPLRILIEGSEESGSPDLEATLELLGERLGSPAILLVLDAGCGNYDQLWLTTSLRGQVAGTLNVSSLREGVHSGDASGIVPSSFRIARHLLSRVEDSASGDVTDPVFNANIPPERRQQAFDAGLNLGEAIYGSFPVQPGTRPSAAAPQEQLLNRTWRPQLTVTGWDGLPDVANAAAVMQPEVSLKLSLRLPPTINAQAAAERLKDLLEQDRPYGAHVTFSIDMVSQGWHAPPLDRELMSLISSASEFSFGKRAESLGGGGGIPFLSMLEERFPKVQFLVTGVLGPQSNAHGPNEFLHLPMAKKLTGSLAYLLHNLGAAA